MRSNRTYVIRATLLLTTLLCTLACNKSNDSSSETDTQAAPPPTDTAPPPAKPDSDKPAPVETASYDLQLIDTMSQHHRDAIEMGQLAATRAHHAELKELGGKLATDLDRQVALLKEWRDQWYTGKPNAENRRLAGMTESMASINMARIDSLSGEDFDRTFLDMMISHHQGATAMAKEAIIKCEHAELKALSEQIAVVQQRELDMMTQWKSLWGPNQ